MDAKPENNSTPTSPQTPLNNPPVNEAPVMPPVSPETPAPAQGAWPEHASPTITPTNPPEPKAATAVPTDAAVPLPPAPTTPAIVVGNETSASETPLQPLQPFTGVPKAKRKLPKLPLFAGLAVLLIAGGAAAYQYGYKTNPSVVYSQSLSNTGKGYEQLVSYLDKQSSANYKGISGSGDYKVVSDGTTTDGKASFKSDGDNTLTTMDIGLGVSRANIEVRSIKSTGTSPDYYLKASGITGLDSLVGAETGAQFAKLNDKWILIDHTLIDNYSSQIAQSSAGSPPSKEQILDEAKAFGSVNDEYVFSTDANKAIFKRTSEAKAETVDGHKTIHYKVSFVKANVKKYVTAQHDALLKSKLGDWIKKNKYEDAVKSSYESALKSTDNVKERESYDLWLDVDSRVIYKFRVPTEQGSTTEYTDIGLDYEGGDSYPFFFNSKYKDGTAGFNLTLNSKSNEITAKLNVKSTGEAAMDFSGNFTFKPTNDLVKIEAPAGAMQLGDALKLVGLGDLYNYYADPSNATSSSMLSSDSASPEDAKREVDIRSLQNQLEVYYADNGNYPSFAQFNSASWRASNMKNLDADALQDPNGSSTQLSRVPVMKVYAYSAVTTDGTSCETSPTDCQRYTLNATLSDGSLYTEESLD